MPVTRLKVFEFLTQYLSHAPFWCQRLALVQPGEQRQTQDAPLKDDDKKIWQDIRTQLNAILAQEQTFQAFLTYLVNDGNLMGPAYAADNEPSADNKAVIQPHYP